MGEAGGGEGEGMAVGVQFEGNCNENGHLLTNQSCLLLACNDSCSLIARTRVEFIKWSPSKSSLLTAKTSLKWAEQVSLKSPKISCRSRLEHFIAELG